MKTLKITRQNAEGARSYILRKNVVPDKPKIEMEDGKRSFVHLTSGHFKFLPRFLQGPHVRLITSGQDPGRTTRSERE